jgi:hypothetical protein
MKDPELFEQFIADAEDELYPDATRLLPAPKGQNRKKSKAVVTNPDIKIYS